MSDIQEDIKNQVTSNKVMLYMKGSKLMPMCGFSARAVQVLKSVGAEFETANVLESDELRQGIKDYSNWPTIPQLYINGEFVGGSDIMMEMFENGELQKAIGTPPADS